MPWPGLVLRQPCVHEMALPRQRWPPRMFSNTCCISPFRPGRSGSIFLHLAFYDHPCACGQHKGKMCLPEPVWRRPQLTRSRLKLPPATCRHPVIASSLHVKNSCAAVYRSCCWGVCCEVVPQRKFLLLLPCGDSHLIPFPEA